MPRNAVIITGPGFQDHDVIYSYYCILEEGWHVDIATKYSDSVVGKYGVPLPMDKTAKPLITAVTAAPASAAIIDPAVIGPNQYFSGVVNGHTGHATINMACFGPIRPGQTGHPLAGQRAIS
jgi:hypothetical protein